MVRKSAAVYFAIQGLGILAWWCLLYFMPGSRQYFQMGAGVEVLLSFWLPDILFLAIGSIATAFLLWTDHRFAVIALWFVTGLITYASVYTFSFALMTDTGWLGVVFMIPAMIWSGVFGVGLPPVSDYMFRPTKPAQTGWILTKTISQIVIVWSVILIVFPFLITEVEAKLGIPNYTFPFQKTLAGILFLAISSLGVYSAFVMSKVGKGTPLPLDHASELVALGPYAYVRNPMAVSGIGQGIAVALFLGSPLVLLYAFMGSAIWQVVFRPLEEEDLSKRFGEKYDDYRRKVRCWVPNSKPYDPANSGSVTVARPSELS